MDQHPLSTWTYGSESDKVPGVMINYQRPIFSYQNIFFVLIHFDRFSTVVVLIYVVCGRQQEIVGARTTLVGNKAQYPAGSSSNPKA
jgi:hypothetical protein